RGFAGETGRAETGRAGATAANATREEAQTPTGVADDVVTLDYDRNGLDDFLVTNGWQSQGPAQLIASFRR
ncbi:MAG: hypothetical protein ACC726_15235, partial [Chloroflexota bacterium]